MRFAERSADWLAEGRVGPFSAAVLVVALYCLIQIVVLPLATALAGTGLGHDDAEQIMYMPYLWLGYGGSQPPLFSWLGWLTASVVGANVLALKILKYGLIFIAMGATRATVLKLGHSQRAAAAAMFGLLLFPQIFWEMQHQLSHSVAALCFSALLILALFNVVQRRSTLSYILFGLAAAAAILSKYNSVILLCALLGAALAVRDTRGAILTPRLVISLLILCLALAPIIYWNATHPADLMARSHKFGIADHGGAIQVAAKGVLELFIAMLNFLIMPAAVFAAALGLARWWPRRSDIALRADARLLWLAMAIGVALMVILVVATGATKIVDRWLLPVLFFLPMAVAISVDGVVTHGRAVQNVVISVGVAVAIGALPVTWYKQVRGGQGKSRITQMQYGELYADLTRNGKVKTVISDWHWPANLRLVDPDIIALGGEVPDFGSLIEEPAMLTWLDTDAPEGDIVQRLELAGYVPEGSPETVIVPEFLNGDAPGRRVSFVRLKKRDSP